MLLSGFEMGYLAMVLKVAEEYDAVTNPEPETPRVRKAYAVRERLSFYYDHSRASCQIMLNNAKGEPLLTVSDVGIQATALEFVDRCKREIADYGKVTP